MMSTSNIRRHGRRGFTLVELIVVISIVAVLIALLLPALSRSRAMAMRVICASQIRQQFMAYIMYVQDFEGHSVAPFVYGATMRGLYKDYTTPSHYVGAGSYVNGPTNLGVLVGPYLGGNVGVMYCPDSTRSTRQRSGGETHFRNWLNTGTVTGQPLLGYALRPGSFSNATAWTWSERTSFYHKQLASRFENNLKGAPRIHPSTGAVMAYLEAPHSLIVDATPMVYWEWKKDSLHQSEGFNAGYADGVIRWVPITAEQDAYIRTRGWHQYTFLDLADPAY